MRLVIARSVCYDHIYVETAGRAGGFVANQPEVIAESVAEHALIGILAAARGLVEASGLVGEWARSEWPCWRLGTVLFYGGSVSLLGAGRIASSLLRRLSGLRPSRALYYTRIPKPSHEHVYGARRARLEEVFGEGEILMDSLPLNTETRDLVTVKVAPPPAEGAIYVNVERSATEEPGAICKVAEEGLM